MTNSAILSFCPDLTNPSARGVPLFRVSLGSDRKLSVSFLQTTADTKEIVGFDNTTMGIVQWYPWYLNSLFSETGADSFFDRLVEATRFSSIYVERFEP